MTRHMLNKFVPFSFAVLLGIAATTYGAVPSINVTVSDARGKVAFRGMTNTDATFATANLPSGNYVVQFGSKDSALKPNHYLIVVSAGEKKVVADAVPGEKITAGGVAMKVAVKADSKIAGHVASERPMASNGNPYVIVRNGKRYAWATAETGSNLGGHWVEEGLGEARNIVRFSPDEMRKVHDRAGEGSMLNHVNHQHYTGR